MAVVTVEIYFLLLLFLKIIYKFRKQKKGVYN